MNDTELCYKGIKEGMLSDNPTFVLWALEHFVEDFPDFLWAFWDLAQFYMKAGEHAKAQKYYEIAGTRWPDNFELKKEIADFYYVVMNDHKKALPIYERLVSEGNFDVQTYLTTAHLYVTLDRFDDAILLYEKILSVQPGQKDARLNLEKVAKAKNDQQLFPTEDMYEHAMNALNSGETNKAIDLLEALLKTTPEHAGALNDLGVLYYQKGEKEKSLAYYEKAVSFAPENANFLKNLGDYYFIEMHQAKEALDIYVKLLQSNPEDVEVLFNIGIIVKSLERWDDAKVFFDKILTIDPNNEGAKEQLRFIASLSASVSGEPESTLMDTVTVDKKEEERPEIIALRKKIAENPQEASHYNDIGVMLYKDGKKEEARFNYEKAVSLNPENTVFQKNLADFYFVELGKIEESIKIYHGILEKDPEDIETLMNLGLICLSLSLAEDAKVFFERVMEIQPWNLEGQNALDRAKEIMEKGNLSPNDTDHSLKKRSVNISFE